MLPRDFAGPAIRYRSRGREEVEEVEEVARSSDQHPMMRRTARDIIFFASATGVKRHSSCRLPARYRYVISRERTYEPRSIDTSVHGAGKLSRPQSFALWKVPLSVERSTGPFCENPRSLEGEGGERGTGGGTLLRSLAFFLLRVA